MTYQNERNYDRSSRDADVFSTPSYAHVSSEVKSELLILKRSDFRPNFVWHDLHNLKKFLYLDPMDLK